VKSAGLKCKAGNVEKKTPRITITAQDFTLQIMQVCIIAEIDNLIDLKFAMRAFRRWVVMRDGPLDNANLQLS
jgi:hypothetical protein